jgi:hypothetical protein
MRRPRSINAPSWRPSSTSRPPAKSTWTTHGRRTMCTPSRSCAVTTAVCAARDCSRWRVPAQVRQADLGCRHVVRARGVLHRGHLLPSPRHQAAAHCVRVRLCLPLTLSLCVPSALLIVRAVARACSQFLILPPYQRQGHGSACLDLSRLPPRAVGLLTPLCPH